MFYLTINKQFSQGMKFKINRYFKIYLEITMKENIFINKRGYLIKLHLYLIILCYTFERFYKYAKIYKNKRTNFI